MSISHTLRSRYSTKLFDANKQITEQDFRAIKDALRFSPSSVNSQPWHFIIANTEAGKARIAKSAVGNFAYNKPKIENASHVVVFAVRTELSEDYLAHLLAVEDADGRYASADFKQSVSNGRGGFVAIHRELKDTQQWMQKQLYLNMGSTLLAAAAAGIDAVPMEGVDVDVLNQEFDLPAQGFNALAVVSFGYRAEDDFNAALPKSRLPEDEIFSLI